MSRGVILGGEQAPAALTIYVPRGHEDTVVVGVCNVCGAEFGAGQELTWQRHVGDCAREHMDEIQAERPSVRNKGGPWDPETWDPEWEAHQREVGRRMLREGRWETKPSER